VDLKDLLEGAKLVRAERLAKVLTSLENNWDEEHQDVVRSNAPLLLEGTQSDAVSSQPLFLLSIA
jgi:hypothetical protein